MSDSAAYTVAAPNPHWLAMLRQAVAAPPRRARVPLLAGGSVIGSVDPELFCGLALPLLSDGQPVLRVRASGGWEVLGELSASLALLARALQIAGLAGTWRDELLAVTDTAGQRLGVVERGAVRPLGLATQAVHLIGWGPEGGPGDGADFRVWVQQRSWDKASEPGLWDTLMGGMVAAEDSLTGALARETWEEAGLRLDQVRGLRHGGAVDLCPALRHRQHGLHGGAHRLVQLHRARGRGAGEQGRRSAAVPS